MVKVTVSVEGTPSVASLLLIPIITLLTGWEVSTRVKLSVPPASVVTSPEVGATVVLDGLEYVHGLEGVHEHYARTGHEDGVHAAVIPEPVKQGDEE